MFCFVRRKTMKKFNTKTITSLGIMSAVIVVLQLLGSFIRFGPFSISLVNIPIVVGAVLYGPFGGALLGLVFGLTVLLSGDAALFLAVSVPGTVITVIVKGVLAGVVSGIIYKAAKKAGTTIAVIAAAVACPIVNTGTFLSGCLVFFMDTINGWAAAAGLEGHVGTYMLAVLAGGNFIVEMLVSAALSPAVLRLLKIIKRV